MMTANVRFDDVTLGWRRVIAVINGQSDSRQVCCGVYPVRCNSVMPRLRTTQLYNLRSTPEGGYAFHTLNVANAVYLGQGWTVQLMLSTQNVRVDGAPRLSPVSHPPIPRRPLVGQRLQRLRDANQLECLPAGRLVGGRVGVHEGRCHADGRRMARHHHLEPCV